MMDRNLGATSATPGDIGAFGLLYQWGRKDPFMGICAKSENTFAASTGTWNTISGEKTIDWAEENPTTFITGNDWCVATSIGLYLWKDDSKTLYDPCPVGYRVPKGGNDGFWATALGTSSSTSTGTKWDSTNSGRHWTLANGTTAAWYPAVGYRSYNSGVLDFVGSNGYYWSASPHPSDRSRAYYLNFYNGNVNPAYDHLRSYGHSVRCVKE
jgi:uncharacterized protein (TIGR02145 family)